MDELPHIFKHCRRIEQDLYSYQARRSLEYFENKVDNNRYGSDVAVDDWSHFHVETWALLEDTLSAHRATQ
jgi:hypothetical protein